MTRFALNDRINIWKRPRSSHCTGIISAVTRPTTREQANHPALSQANNAGINHPEVQPIHHGKLANSRTKQKHASAFRAVSGRKLITPPGRLSVQTRTPEVETRKDEIPRPSTSATTCGLRPRTHSHSLSDPVLHLPQLDHNSRILAMPIALTPSPSAP